MPYMPCKMVLSGNNGALKNFFDLTEGSNETYWKKLEVDTISGWIMQGYVLYNLPSVGGSILVPHTVVYGCLLRFCW